MPPHLLRWQGIAVGDDSVILGRLEGGVPSTFSIRVEVKYHKFTI